MNWAIDETVSTKTPTLIRRKTTESALPSGVAGAAVEERDDFVDKWTWNEILDDKKYELVTLGNLTIDREAYRVLLEKEEISLPRKEFELLSLLASKPGKVFTREDILQNVWGNEVVVGGRTIDVHIRKLREKLGDEKFRTVKGVGYKFSV